MNDFNKNVDKIEEKVVEYAHGDFDTIAYDSQRFAKNVVRDVKEKIFSFFNWFIKQKLKLKKWFWIKKKKNFLESRTAASVQS